MHRRSVFPALALLFLASCQLRLCSTATGKCDPRNANCPAGYQCALAEICTRKCEQSSDCWIKVVDGCRYDGYLPGETMADGGTFSDQTSEDGICPETKSIECVSGYCQAQRCATESCDYDLYGPSEFKGATPHGSP